MADMVPVVTSLIDEGLGNVMPYYGGPASFASMVKEDGQAAVLAREAAHWDPLMAARQAAEHCADCHG